MQPFKDIVSHSKLTGFSLKKGVKDSEAVWFFNSIFSPKCRPGKTTEVVYIRDMSQSIQKR